ncbi:DNA-binding LacI/PurR family transcriptional regulator [Friedmanniella endophytica]|uniref:DNA-binding LacI/PurR family transcriptional regulator n=1 Tax=Microlunatus kandeliicorticis TaxID=1759536 RepID=A0A7W3IVB0_9ACTN|nr:LacI family DNA-binding transcriptional regulator [Microlunatus kandeliicorticis]MBA8795845.1 DNA-binding LacI/PurR family transcriptional regulator [Microlunatus kandeliicorticis]
MTATTRAKVTIKTLAHELGVSPATVSNAYNKPDQLSEELRIRILAKAEELGYGGPSAAGRSLRSGKANAFGVMFVGRLSYAFSDPFAAVFLGGLAGAVEETGISIALLPVLGTADDPDITSVRQANIDGLVTMCVELDHPAVQLTRARGLPVVSTDVTDEPDAWWAAIDDEQAGADLGAHLAGLGHREIAVVVDTHRPVSTSARLIAPAEVLETDARARLAGLQRAMPGARIDVIAAGHNAVESGRVAGGFALDGLPSRPTAVVCLSDVLALGVLDTLRARGLRAPDDLSVCGFDDVPAAAEAGLTTIHQPIEEKGRQVGLLLLDLDSPQRQVLLPHELVVRASSGSAPR